MLLERKNKMKSRLFNPPQLVKEIAGLFIGVFLYALGVHMFTSPNNIAPGGVSGIGTMLNHLFNIPIGSVIIAFNIPLFVFSKTSKVLSAINLSYSSFNLSYSAKACSTFYSIILS